MFSQACVVLFMEGSGAHAPSPLKRYLGDLPSPSQKDQAGRTSQEGDLNSPVDRTVLSRGWYCFVMLIGGCLVI